MTVDPGGAVSGVALTTELLGRAVGLRPLPDAPPLLAPVARRAMRRAGLAYGVLWVFGVSAASWGPPTLATAGAGLLLPGGAHLVHGQVPHAGVAITAFAVAVLLWWMIGAAVLPPVVWLATLVSAVVSHHHGTPEVGWLVGAASVVPGGAVLATAVHVVRHRRQVLAGRQLNVELAEHEAFRTALPSSTSLPVGEASPEDLAHLRLALDLALQPLDRFDGFDRRDQFREAALRYQLCILGYALSTFRFTHTPAWSGALGEAQARAILKTGDRRVWGYWPLENAWGRFAIGRDPVANVDNVMLTGWQGVAVGMLESLEDDRFSRPGALSYRWSEGESYDHDFHSLVGSVHDNMRRSDLTLYSVEQEVRSVVRGWRRPSTRRTGPSRRPRPRRC